MQTRNHEELLTLRPSLLTRLWRHRAVDLGLQMGMVLLPAKFLHTILTPLLAGNHSQQQRQQTAEPF